MLTNNEYSIGTHWGLIKMTKQTVTQPKVKPLKKH